MLSPWKVQMCTDNTYEFQTCAQKELWIFIVSIYCVGSIGDQLAILRWKFLNMQEHMRAQTSLKEKLQHGSGSSSLLWMNHNTSGAIWRPNGEVWPYCKEPHLKKSIYGIPEQTPHANCKHGGGGVIIWDLWPQDLGILHCCPWTCPWQPEMRPSVRQLKPKLGHAA